MAPTEDELCHAVTQFKVKRPNPAPPGPDLSTAIFSPHQRRQDSASPRPWPQEAHADLGLVDDDGLGVGL
jgi:hypothetical protein